jgi:hypothetical protein
MAVGCPQCTAIDGYFLDFATPLVVPAPDSFMVRPPSSGRVEPWLPPASMPDEADHERHPWPSRNPRSCRIWNRCCRVAADVSACLF